LTIAAITDLYPSYEDALAVCGDGYSDADLAEVIAFKTSQPVQRDCPAPEQATNSIIAVSMAASGNGHGQPLKVLDLGGGCGFHYLWACRTLQMPLRWAIVETKAMAERAAAFGGNHFRTFTNISGAAAALGPIDLVHISGALPYVPDPIETLREIVACRPRYIMLARFPIWREAAIVGIQKSLLSDNGIGSMPPTIEDREIRHPVTFANIDDVMRLLLEDYEIALTLSSTTAGYLVQGKEVLAASIIFRIKG
jgi:putative methyltransferase (TIGR04325 family)